MPLPRPSLPSLSARTHAPTHPRARVRPASQPSWSRRVGCHRTTSWAALIAEGMPASGATTDGGFCGVAMSSSGSGMSSSGSGPSVSGVGLSSSGSGSGVTVCGASPRPAPSVAPRCPFACCCGGVVGGVGMEVGTPVPAWQRITTVHSTHRVAGTGQWLRAASTVPRRSVRVASGQRGRRMGMTRPHCGKGCVNTSVLRTERALLTGLASSSAASSATSNSLRRADIEEGGPFGPGGGGGRRRG